eukprot:4230734-Lingulodinium_polyedra.AAC.1
MLIFIIACVFGSRGGSSGTLFAEPRGHEPKALRAGSTKTSPLPIRTRRFASRRPKDSADVAAKDS